ncbi:hypothetical protein EOPP23_00840 [Endozoicomonas sp. OPT23]|uniref:hypothetical protein n=1 Tax=Endozoicomonas sp. OPT23 TaxID=2072845 RepID=UPI00129BF32E|nr:hypothetical protein [Endozoicomonas sp. OPT23]MRI31537.1 hypothetical protein [Endozoicomonas sp. OPT23]
MEPMNSHRPVTGNSDQSRPIDSNNNITSETSHDGRIQEASVTEGYMPSQSSPSKLPTTALEKRKVSSTSNSDSFLKTTFKVGAVSAVGVMTWPVLGLTGVGVGLGISGKIAYDYWTGSREVSNEPVPVNPQQEEDIRALGKQVITANKRLMISQQKEQVSQFDIATLRTTIKDLERQVRTKQKTVDKKGQQRAKESIKIKELETQLNELSNQYDKALDDKEELKTRLDSSLAELERQQKSLTKFSAQDTTIKRLQENTSEKEKEVNSLRAELSSKEDEIQKLQTRLKQAVPETASTSSQTVTTNAPDPRIGITPQEGVPRTLFDELSQPQDYDSDSDSGAFDLSRSGSFSDYDDSLKAELEEAQQQLTLKKDELRRLEDTVEPLTEERDGIKKKLVDTAEQLQLKESKVTELEEQVNSLQKEKTEIVEALDGKDRVVNRLSEEQEENKKLKQQLTLLNEENTSVRNELKDVKQELGNLRTSRDQLDKKLKIAQKQLDDFSIEKDNQEETVSGLEQQWNRTDEERRKLGKELEGLYAQLQQLVSPEALEMPGKQIDQSQLIHLLSKQKEYAQIGQELMKGAFGNGADAHTVSTEDIAGELTKLTKAQEQLTELLSRLNKAGFRGDIDDVLAHLDSSPD